jgi:hypothetical protein
MAITLTVTIVDHTDSPNMLAVIMPKLEDILGDLIWEQGEVSAVNMRRVTTTPVPGDQDLVLHFVRDVANSYVFKKMPGEKINPKNGGFTRSKGNTRGSEFYKVPRQDADGYARLAAHEAMHNVTRAGNELHADGGIAASPPQAVNDKNRQKFQTGLNKLPDQLL